MPFAKGLVEVRSSAKHGRGLFAKCNVPAGTTLWRFSAPSGAEAEWESLTDEPLNCNRTYAKGSLLAMEDNAPEQLETILWGGYVHTPTGVFIEIRDGCNYTNHSETPNSGGEWSAAPEDEFSVAVRDIDAGEEITEDYGVWREFEVAPWLVPLFQKYCPDRYAFETANVTLGDKGYITGPNGARVLGTVANGGPPAQRLLGCMQVPYEMPNSARADLTITDECARKRRRGETGPTGLPPAPTEKFAKFEGNTFLIMGFGSIGQGSLPLVLRHIDLRPEQVIVLTGEDRKEEADVAAEKYGIKVTIGKLTKENYEQVLEPLKLGAKDFMFNVTVDVSSTDMMKYCNERGVLYVDTVIEPWLGGYTDASVSPAMRTNYMMREGMLECKRKFGPSAVTALTTHGANPGMVSHFVKQALINIAMDTGHGEVDPKSKRDWAELAQKLGIKTIHIAERDTQVRQKPKEVGEFVNTWSIDGFISEGCQPSELGWGTHEKQLPPDGNHHAVGTKASIWLNQPGVRTKVRTWTPMEGEFHGFCVTHNESISIADYFTIPGEDGNPVYRPTVHYAYHPCDDAVLSLHELAGKNYVEQKKKSLMLDDITFGVDELGVLLGGHAKGAYWFGSQLEVHHSRQLCELNQATSLQVTATAVAGAIWAIENPKCGVVEPDEIEHNRILEIITPYVAPVVGVYTDWTPLYNRETLFKEDIDRDDAWQFKNVRVSG